MTSSVTSTPGRLVVEVTEHARVPGYDDLRSVLRPWRRAGVRVAVDDAGAGFASLRHVLNLEPDVLKLDRSIVQDVDSDPRRRALVGCLVGFAGQVQAQVVAEGIETPAELDTLIDLGAELGQGYLLGRPDELAVHLGHVGHAAV